MTEEYSVDLVVREHACGPGDVLKLKDLLDYLQDIAAEHASKLGVGIRRVGELKELWVLSRLKLGINRDIRSGERLRLVTYPSGLNLLFAVREFELLDDEGKVVCDGTSYWLLLDSCTFHPVRPREHLPSSLLAMEAVAHYEDLGKIQRQSQSREVFRTTVRASDLDVNEHLNNAQYGRYITDVACELSVGPVRFSHLQINYNHQALPGDEICCGGCVDEAGGLYVEGVSADGRVSYFQAKGELALR